MKISNAFMFDRASEQMSALQGKLVKSQAQVASGKQVIRPSDAPNQMATIERFKSLQTKQDNYLSNMGLVKARLDGEVGAVGSIIELMFRAKELVVQASNETLNPEDRKAIAAEMGGLREQIMSLANTQDINGNFLFSGSRVNQPPFAPPADDPNASPIYQGDQTRMEVMIGDQRSLPINRPGSEVFVRVVRTDGNGQAQGIGFFQAFDDLVAGIEQSKQTDIQRGHGELDRLMEGLALAEADIGTDQAILDHQTATTEDIIATIKASLSNVEDLDYAKAITEMNKQILSLEAAQSSFAKISQLNLFDYLR
jgi:flagellar hook-associated protein 3 FlgL